MDTPPESASTPRNMIRSPAGEMPSPPKLPDEVHPSLQAEDSLPTGAGVPPASVSRIDTVADEFAKMLSRRKYVAGEVLASRYRIVRELGGGGMGRVFVAENLAIGQKVALKVVKPELLENDTFRKRFQKEAEAIAAVEHQNVVRFIDLIVGDPTFLIMEYVDGPTVTTVLARETRLVPVRAAELARRLCWGLDAAHRAGVIHRDVKPSNIILAPDAECGEQPKLIDFGVAKTLTGPLDSQLTRHGQMVGTPAYMSPEQITGAEVDERSDIYALGCVLYHMVAGRPPFAGFEEYQLLQQHVERPPPALADVVADAPPELDRVLKRALAKDPALRFASMAEMALALAEVVRPKPQTVVMLPGTEAVTHTSRVRKVPRSRVPMWAVGIALGGVVGVLVTWLAMRRPSGLSSGLLIASDPPGATVVIDGRVLAETTPTAQGGLAPGKHRIRVQHVGRDPVEQVAMLGKDERALVEIALPPASRFISVTSLPAGASVFLDGRRVGGVTPTRLSYADGDFHEVRVELLGYAPTVRRITPDDRDAEISVTLQPESRPRGYLIVESSRTLPVWVDGADTTLLAPTSPILVAVGEHLVQLREDGAVRAAARVTIRHGEYAHVSLDPEGR